MSDQGLIERYFLARVLWWREAIQELEVSAVEELAATLESLKRELADMITSTDWQKTRLEQVENYCNELLAAASANMAETITAASAYAGAASLANWNNMLSLGGVAVGIGGVELSQGQIRSWFQDTPLGGRTLAEWVEKAFDEGVAGKLKQSLRIAAIKGQGYRPMVKNLMRESLDAGHAITEREAITLARTYTQTANVEAQKAVYEKNKDIVYAQKWVSVLDNRVCPVCASLDGRIYKNGEKMPAMPIHPRCRCLALPCVRVDEMGITSEDLDKVARPWVIRGSGNIDTGGRRKILNYGHTTENFDGWYKSLPKKEQTRIVGKVRQELLADGKITFEDLVDRTTGKLRTLKDLGFGQSGHNL